MNFRVKIHGAGSIGNHLANAARRLGWTVHVCDVNPAALERMRTDLYPARYGRWDEQIELFASKDAPRGGYDLILIGTPPEHHVPLALAALDEAPKAIQIEKPLCAPDLADAQTLFAKAQALKIPMFMGYDHVVGAAARDVSGKLTTNYVGKVESLDVEFREHWGGIFAAHHWLSGPADSYLGYWKRGGGASGEHSHAINLWQHFAHLAGGGRVVEVGALIEYVREGRTEYDKLCALHLACENGLAGRVVQDVITRPVRKWGRVQGAEGYVEWYCGLNPGCDEVHFGKGADAAEKTVYRKTRPDDFLAELNHIHDCVAQGAGGQSPISLERGLDTMMVIAAAHLSAQSRRNVKINYAAGYVPEALSLC
jgi:predicted dehydrogenase